MFLMWLKDLVLDLVVSLTRKFLKVRFHVHFFHFYFFAILEHDIEYHGMVIRDNVEASDSGQQQILFKKAADIIESSLQAKVCNILCLFYVFSKAI